MELVGQGRSVRRKTKGGERQKRFGVSKIIFIRAELRIPFFAQLCNGVSVHCCIFQSLFGTISLPTRDDCGKARLHKAAFSGFQLKGGEGSKERLKNEKTELGAGLFLLRMLLASL